MVKIRSWKSREADSRGYRERSSLSNSLATKKQGGERLAVGGKGRRAHAHGLFYVPGACGGDSEREAGLCRTHRRDFGSVGARADADHGSGVGGGACLVRVQLHADGMGLNMPAFLRTIANWNPFSATVQACRQLFGNLPAGYPVPDAWPMQHPVWASLPWSVLIVVVFRTLAVRKYRRGLCRCLSGGEDGDAVSEQFQPENEEQDSHHGDIVLGCPVFPAAERGSGSLSSE